MPNRSQIITSQPEDHFCLAPTNKSSNTLFPPDPLLIFWQYCSGALCLSGSLINWTLLFVLVSCPKLTRGAGFFIALLIADNFVLNCALVPASIYFVAQATTGLQPVNCAKCRYLMFFHATVNMLSQWLEALLAINRLVAVLLPTRYEYIKRPWVQWLASFACLSFVLATTTPGLFDTYVVFRMSSLGLCNVIPRHHLSSGIASFNVYVPLLFNAAAVLVVSRTMVLSRVRGQNRLQPVREGVVNAMTPRELLLAQRRKQTTGMLFLSFATTLVCQLPILTLSLAFPDLLSRKPILYPFLRLGPSIQANVIPVRIAACWIPKWLIHLMFEHWKLCRLNYIQKLFFVL